MTKHKLTTLKPRLPVLNTLRTSAIATPSTSSKQVYDSRRWRERVRPAKLKRDPLCQRCKHLGHHREASDVDHWQRISCGGDPWHESNLVSLCSPCHAEKSQLERAEQPLFQIAPSAPSEQTLVLA